MTTAKLVFILMSLLFFGFIPMFIKQRKLYFIGLASSLYIFSSGWIFYHFNGVMLGDIPIFILFIMALTSRNKMSMLVRPIGLPLLLYMAWCLVSAIGAIRPGWVISETTTYLRMYLLIVGIANNIRNMKELRAAVYGMLIGLLIESFIGIYQWRFGPLGIWYLGERTGGRIQWRTMGTFFVPSFYANYLALMLPIAFRMFIYYRPPKKNLIFFFGAVFCLGIVALFTTYGRGPWIGFSAAIIVIVLWSTLKSRFKSRIRWTIPVLIVFGMLFFLRYHNAIWTQFTSSRKASTEVRFPQFRIAWRIIKSNPVKGVGLGNYELNSWDFMTADEARNPYARAYAMMVHNVYLFVSAETGLVGGVLLILWLFTIFLTAVRILKSKIINDFIVNVTLGIFGGMLAISIIFTFSPDIHEYQILYQIGLFCGLLVAMQRMVVSAQHKMRRMKKKNSVQDSPERTLRTVRNG